MANVQVLKPIESFLDVDGDPLEDGYIFIGADTLDPESNPIQAYWDEALTVPAAQPIRTKGGYPSNAGSPSKLYIAQNSYSIRTKNKNGTAVSSDLNASSPDSSAIIFQRPESGSVPRTVSDKLLEYPTPGDFGAVGNGIANDDAAFVALEAAVKHQEIDLLGKTYLVTAEYYGNIYYNGNFKLGTQTFKKNRPTIAPTGAGQPDYNFNASMRYEFASMNGQTVTRGSQAFCFDERNRYLFSLEGDRINRFPMDGLISVTELDYTQPASTVIGHQGLAIEYLPANDFRLWTTSATVGRSACRFIYTPNGPINTVEEYELFTSGAYANSTSCTPTISYDGKYLLAHGTIFGTFITVIRVFELAKLIAGGPGDYTDKWLYQWQTQGIVGDVDHPLQGLACDGKTAFLMAGGTGFVITKRLYTFTLDGTLIAKEDDITIGATQAAGDGTGVKYEPEGLSIMGGPNGSTTLMVGILSGDTPARRFRIYGVAMAKPTSVEKTQYIGNVKSSIFGTKATGRNYLAIRSTDDLATGSGINLYGNGDSGTPGGYGLFINGLTRQAVSLNGNAIFKSDAGVSPITAESNGSGRAIEFSRSGSVNGFVNISTSDVSLVGLNGVQVRFQTGAAGTGTTRCLVQPTGHFEPFVTATYNNGGASAFWLASYAVTRFYTATVFDAAGAGSPEGVVTAGIGSTFRRTNGGALTSFYVKETGAGNTGWVAK